MSRLALRPGQIGEVSAKRLTDGLDGKPRWRARVRVRVQGDVRQVSRVARTDAAAKAAARRGAADLLDPPEKPVLQPKDTGTVRDLLVRCVEELNDAGVHTRTRRDYGYAAASLLAGAEYSRAAKGTADRAKSQARAAFVAVENKPPA